MDEKLKKTIETTITDTLRPFVRLEEKIEAVAVNLEELRGDIRICAEKVVHLDNTLDRAAADIRAEMRRGFAETQALLRSYM